MGIAMTETEYKYFKRRGWNDNRQMRFWRVHPELPNVETISRFYDESSRWEPHWRIQHRETGAWAFNHEALCQIDPNNIPAALVPLMDLPTEGSQQQ